MVLIVLSRALDLARARFATLFSAGWGYMLLLVALNLAISVRLMPEAGFVTGSYMMEPIPDVADAGRQEAALRLLAMAANVLAGFSIGVAYLRRVLLGRREFPLAFGLRNLRVGWKIVLLAVLGAVCLVPLLVVSSVLVAVFAPLGLAGLVATPFLALMLMQRLSLVLPAAALDDPMTLAESWRLTRGLGTAIAVAALVLSLLVLVALGLWWGAVALAEALAAALLPLALSGAGLAEADRIASLLRSALVPAGAMVLVTWLFASLHATSYALARERFAAEIGLRRAEAERAELARAGAQQRAARRAVASVLGPRRGPGAG